MKNFIKIIVPKIPILSLLLSAVVAWFLVPVSKGFPMVPFAFFYICLSTLVFLIRKDRSWFDTVLYLGILGLSLFLVLHANEVIQFITFLFIFAFGSLLIVPLTSGHTLPTLLFTPLSIIKEALIGKNIFPYSFGDMKKYNKTSLVKRYALSILITLLFLVITIPLLASANPIFHQEVQNFLNFFNLSFLAHYFGSEQIAINTVRIVFFVFLAYIIPRVLTASFNGTKINSQNFSLPINYLIPKIAMGLLLVVFFVSQAQLYFATPAILHSLGYTHARLTNEVFFQVTIVAFIIFVLSYMDHERKIWNKRLTYFLLLEAFFLIGIAFKSVFDYSILWGLSEKRLWGYATMSWLTGALLLFLYYYKKQIPLARFFQLVITYTIIVLLSINIANFDSLIAHSTASDKIDYVYLSTLSPDAHSYKSTLEYLTTHLTEGDTSESVKLFAANTLLRKISMLQQKYHNNIPINSFNFSEYREYLSVADIDTNEFSKRLSSIDQEYQEQEKRHNRVEPMHENKK
jgi:hypothetical protein